MHRLAVAGGCLTLKHAIIADNAGHTQAIVGKYAAPPLSLRATVLAQIAPIPNRLLVSEL